MPVFFSSVAMGNHWTPKSPVKFDYAAQTELQDPRASHLRLTALQIAAT